MTSDYDITASIRNASHEAIQAAFEQLFPGIKVRSRMYGLELKYADEQVELHVECPNPSDGTYFLDTKFRGTETEMQALGNRIGRELVQQGLDFHLGGQAYDAQDEPVGEEWNFRSVPEGE